MIDDMVAASGKLNHPPEALSPYDFNQQRASYKIGPAVDSPSISEAWPIIEQDKDQL